MMRSVHFWKKAKSPRSGGRTWKLIGVGRRIDANFAEWVCGCGNLRHYYFDMSMMIFANQTSSDSRFQRAGN